MNCKHIKRKAMAVALLLFTLLLGVVIATSSCGKAELDGITVEGYREDFFVGDGFETGVDFKVYAVYKDGSREVVTEGVTVTQEKGMDMNTPGDYMITVGYNGKKFVYKVYVNTPDSVLNKLTVDASGAKTKYLLGDSLSLDGIRVTALYKNAQGREIEIVYGELSRFIVAVTASDGETVKNGVFGDFGSYNVTLTLDGLTASYSVNVEGVNLSTVQSALSVGKYGSRFVNSGNIAILEGGGQGAASNTTQYKFKFGDNYTYINEKLENAGDFDFVKDYHYSIDPDTGKLLAVMFEDGESIPSNVYILEAMNGVPMHLWYYDSNVYGVEAALENVYNIAKNDPNGDLVESADASARKYSFSFGYCQKRVNGEDYFFVTQVAFSMAEDYSVSSAAITQLLYTEGFETDASGHTALASDAKYSYRLEIEISQSSGARTESNPYSSGSTMFKDFDLIDVDNFNTVITEDYVISGKTGLSLSILISNISPSTASFDVDLMYFSDGISAANNVIFVGTGFTVYRSGNVINLTLSAGGEWDLIITTKNVTKRIKLQITGVAPTKLKSEVYNQTFNSFAEGATAIQTVKVPMYFRAVPNAYANGEYTATLTSGDESAVELKSSSINGVSCWSFTADRAGTYVITMRSTVAQDITCEIEVTVIEEPDFSELLSGSYSATDIDGNVYSLEFTAKTYEPTLTGELRVTFTSAGGDTKTEVLLFTVVDGDVNIMTDHSSGDILGVAVKVNSDGKLVLEDRYEKLYELQR